MLADRNPSVREAAARTAGSRHAEQLAAVLIEDPSSDVRRAAATTLGHLADGRTADWLISALEDGDAIVRAAVLRALVDLLTRAGAVRRMSAELVAERPQRRRAILYTLAHLHARESAADVRRLADDPEPDVRLAVRHMSPTLYSLTAAGCAVSRRRRRPRRAATARRTGSSDITATAEAELEHRLIDTCAAAEGEWQFQVDPPRA